jgi:hypothetical protein
MTHAIFVTDNLDLALTKLGAGGVVRYTGPHQGVFRFESVKLAARLSARVLDRPDNPLSDDSVTVEIADKALRDFFTLH